MEMEAGSGEGEVSTGMTLQVEISTSRRARRLCEESVNWDQATRLLRGMYMPALTLGLERERAAQENERAARAQEKEAARASASGSSGSGWFTKLFQMEGWNPKKAKKPVKPSRDEQKVTKVWSLAHQAMWP